MYLIFKYMNTFKTFAYKHICYTFGHASLDNKQMSKHRNIATRKEFISNNNVLAFLFTKSFEKHYKF